MIRRAVGIVGLCFIHVCCAAFAVSDEFPAADIEFFEKQIRPLLAEHCLECHGDRKPEGNLRLTSRDQLIAGGDTGPAVNPQNPDGSLLIRAVQYLNEPQMPPKGKLPKADIERLRKWVLRGAPWPAANSPRGSSESSSPAFQITPMQRDWWAYQPIRDSTIPVVQHDEWPKNEIDQFILAELEAREMSPTDPADRHHWLRRATYDLTGLPPTSEEVESFVADASDTAYERVVDRLLQSPAYGQRWARHWLDVARYADYYDANPATRTASCEITEAWRYRDWVVDSLNADLPFDQFIVHQIAGDLLPDPRGEEIYPEGLIATTFLSNGVWDRGDADKEKIVSDMADDNIDVIGKAFLGLTLGCARCHDHKFDPISTADYYALAGMFYSSHILKDLGAKGAEYTMNRVPLVPAAVVVKRDQQVQQLNDLKAKLEELDKQNPKPAENDQQRVQLVNQRDQLQAEMLPEPPLAIAVQEGGTPGGLFPGIQDVPIHIRGSYARLGPIVPRRLPSFFEGDQQPPLAAGSGRRELAAWVASPENPLTARVIVNRVWQWHFGSGLVRTPNNFGLLSEPPSHPELLDWLAARFVEDGWSLKKLHRRIMLSATYQQSSRVPVELVEQDPENRWLGRFAARRLEAEAIRDALLFVSEQLEAAPGGPAGDDFTIRRRSLYVQTARWDRGSYAILFDAANPDSSVEARSVSTVAPQALFLLNNPFLHEQAQHVAKRLIREVPDDVADVESARIQRAYKVLFGRRPLSEELEIARVVVEAGNADAADSMSGLKDLAHILLCSNEFVFVD